MVKSHISRCMAMRLSLKIIKGSMRMGMDADGAVQAVIMNRIFSYARNIGCSLYGFLFRCRD